MKTEIRGKVEIPIANSDVMACKQLLCLNCKSEQDKKNILLQLNSPQQHLIQMVLQGSVFLNDELLEWFSHYGKDKSLSDFNCYPVELPVKTQLLEMPLKPLILYEYLSSLKKKNSFNVGNTPKSIKCFFRNDELSQAYALLTDNKLLTFSDNNWTHSTSKEAIEARTITQEVSSIASFFYSIEFFTNCVQRTLEQAIEYDLNIYGYRNGITFCPYCSELPQQATKIPCTSDILRPFHYNCATAQLFASTEEGFNSLLKENSI